MTITTPSPKPLTYDDALSDLRFWSRILNERREALEEAERKLVEAALALDAVQDSALSPSPGNRPSSGGGE